MKSIKNIVRIERTYYRNLSALIRLSNDTVKISSAVVWDNIKCKLPADLVISDKTEDKNIIYTAKLTILTCVELDRNKHYAYRLKTADGMLILLGNADRPFVTTSKTENHPANMSDNQLGEYVITYVSHRKLPLIIL